MAVENVTDLQGEAQRPTLDLNCRYFADRSADSDQLLNDASMVLGCVISQIDQLIDNLTEADSFDKKNAAEALYGTLYLARLSKGALDEAHIKSCGGL